jgi:hypothetical protein
MVAKTRLNAVREYLTELCKLDQTGTSRQVFRFGSGRPLSFTHDGVRGKG